MTGKIEWGGTPGPWLLSYNGDGKHTIRMGEAITSPMVHDSHLLVEYDHGCRPEDSEQFAEACTNALAMNVAPTMVALLRVIVDPESNADEIAIVEKAQRILGYVDRGPETYGTCDGCDEFFDLGELDGGLCTMCVDEHGG